MKHEDRTGTRWICLTEGALDPGAVAAFLAAPEAGGIDLFVGTTRRWTGGKETEELEYEAYEPMAVGEMRRLADAAAARWPAVRVAVHHRLGVVPVAEASVVVGVSTPHRADAFAACRWLIDTLKRQVPIWKRERYIDGTTEWVRGDAPPDVDPYPDAP